MIQPANIENLKLSDISFLEFNRDVNMKLVNRLLHSMMEYGQLRIPVIVKVKRGPHMDYKCVDGQHLVSALHKAGNKNTDAIIFDSDCRDRIVNVMSVLNNVCQIWRTENFVRAYSALGNDSYTTLGTHVFRTGFTYVISGMILGNASQIKNGKFKVINKDADRLTKHIIDVCGVLKTNNAKFMKAFIGFYRSDSGLKYNHIEFMKLLVDNRFEILDDVKEMKFRLEMLYAKVSMKSLNEM